MPVSYKDIIITPNTDAATDAPMIEFRGANANTNTAITMRMYPDSNGTISFEGPAGQIFSITNDTGNVIYSVSDISGIPSIEVFSNGKIVLAETSGNVFAEGVEVVSEIALAHARANTGVTNAATAQALGVSAFGTANSAASEAALARGTGNTNASDITATEAETVLARDRANTGVSDAATAQASAGDAEATAVAAFGKANTACTQSDSATTTAASAFGTANTASLEAGGAHGTANSATTTASAAFGQANTATSDAAGALSTAGAAFDAANTAGGADTTARAWANTANLTANNNLVTVASAYGVANTGVTDAATALSAAGSAHGTANSAASEAALARGTGNTNASDITATEAETVLARNQANTGVTNAATAQALGVSAFGQANTGVTDAATALSAAGGAHATANSATITASAAFDTANAAGGGGASVTSQNTAPSTPSGGDLWYNTDNGKLLVYYTDTDTSQWVEVVGSAWSNNALAYDLAVAAYNQANVAIITANSVSGAISNVVEDTTPQLGGALSLNSKGITEEFTAGEILADGNLCYYKSDGTMWKADASAAATSTGLLAMCTQAISAAATGTFVMFGHYTTSGLTAGSIYYVSETGAAITATAPSTSNAVVRVVGYATSTTDLFLFPSGAWVEIA